MSAPDPLSPLGAVLAAGRFGAAAGAPVRIGHRRCELVQVLRRRGGDTDAGFRALGLEVPAPGRSSGAGDMVALSLPPQGWLLRGTPGAEGGLARRAAEAFGDAAAVVDQTHGRCVLTLAGAAAVAVLARLCRLDLHPRVFAPGQVAATPLGELPGVLYQTDDTPAFDLMVPATYARAFAEQLAAAAAPVGYDIEGL